MLGIREEQSLSHPLIGERSSHGIIAGTFTEKEQDMFRFFRRKRKLGLALSGGSTRGIAHVGVLKVLVKHAIPVDYIAGTSAGAIVAALFAAGLPMDKIEHIVMELDWLKVVTPTLSFRGIFSSQKIEIIMKKVLPIRTFGETKIPLAIIATDFLKAKEFVFDRKDEEIALAVRASTTIPGVFDPVHYKGHVLLDGCLTNNLPVAIVKKMGADKVIGVNVVSANLKKEPDNLFRVLSRANDVYEIANLAKYKKYTDVLLQPLSEPFEIFSASKILYKKMIDQGEKEAEKHLAAIKALL
jgi:NTE family protein